jgi:hypothetical protein
MKALGGLLQLLLISSASIAFAQSDSAQVAQSILSSFSSTCPSVGSFSRQAVAQANSLVEILRTLRDDPDCKSLSGAISSLNTLSSRVSRITTDPILTEKLRLQKSREEVLFQLSNATDAVEVARLKSSLLFLDIELAKNSGEQQAQNRDRRLSNEADAAQSLVATTQTLLSQALANQKCLMKHPSLLTGFAQIAGAVLSASVDLIGSLVEFVRVSKINSQIDQMSSGILSTAMQCGVEAIAQQYCSASDAFNIVRLKADSLTRADQSRPERPPTEEGIMLGLYLLETDAPVFLDWLQRVAAGEDATNPAAASRQSTLFSREFAIKSSRAQGLGVINDRAESYALLTRGVVPAARRSDDPRWPYLRTTIRQILERVSFEGPLAEIYAAGYVPYYLLGIDDSEAIRDPNKNYIPIESFDPDSVPSWNFPQSLGEVADRFKSLIDRAQVLVDQERSRILITDPLSVIVDGTQEDITGHSPRNAIEHIRSFLTDRKPQKQVLKNPAVAQLYTETAQRLSALLREIDCVTQPQNIADCPADPPGRDPLTLDEKASRALSAIQRIAKLDNGLSLFSERIRWAVRVSLNELLLEPDAKDVQATARLLAADDVIREITGSAGSTDLLLIERDIVKSQSVTQGVLEGFVDVFGVSLKSVIKTYDAQAKSAQEKPDGRNQSSKAELCLKIASAPLWPTQVPRSWCVGTQIKSTYFYGPTAPVINEELLAKPFEERVCMFRDFSRRSRIYERFARNP